VADTNEWRDVEAIKRLRAQYCLLLDAKDWSALRKIFADDLRARVRDDGTGDFTSADDFLEYLHHLADELHTHVAMMPIIEFTGPDTAHGLWAFSNRDAYGHYQEEYIRQDDGGWLISSLTMTWIIPPSEELKRTRKGAFQPVAERWRSLAAAWGHVR
jgi:hypothetical protein